MSRTYRCRHLPMTREHRGGFRARKITDGARGPSWRERHDAVAAKVEALLGPYPSPGMRMVHKKGLTHKHYIPAEGEYRQYSGLKYFSSEPRYRWVSDMKIWVVTKPSRVEVLSGKLMKLPEAVLWDQTRDAIEAETIWPISSWHPLQRHQQAIGRKKGERVSSNRAARRHTTQLLRSEVIDDDWEGHFPGRRDYFDWWAIY